MSEFVTVARPYAKAAFDFAVEHQSMDFWQSMLTLMAGVTSNEQIKGLISGTSVPETLSKNFIAICGDELNDAGQNLIKLMAENGRIRVLPQLLEHFIRLRASFETVAEVEVTSADSISKEQQAKITAAMEKRLSHKVKLNCKIDKSILAGVVIRTGDIVIDGSIRNRLERLVGVLQS
jgi:F-type H+-transporting ATPase subunit delta